MKKGALISLDRDTAEIEELCRSADVEILYVVMQRRSRPDQTYYLGRGRFNELKDLLAERPVDLHPEPRMVLQAGFLEDPLAARREAAEVHSRRSSTSRTWGSL